MLAGGGKELICLGLLLTCIVGNEMKLDCGLQATEEALCCQERSLLYWGRGWEEGGVIPLGQTKPHLCRYFCISHMKKVMGETRAFTHHASTARAEWLF